MSADRCDSAEKIVRCLRNMCRRHVKKLTQCSDDRWLEQVYRIFFYDAQPYDGKAHHPIDNHPLDFAKSTVAQDRRTLFELLRKERKLALRLGKVTREHDWLIDPALTKKLLHTRSVLSALGDLDKYATQQDAPPLTLTQEQVRKIAVLRTLWQSLDSHSVRLGLRQKGVDMRIGIDIASLTLKQQADTLILVAGDSDFVPAAKLARREGIEFILDPLWQNINPDLFEHIDGLQSGFTRPGAVVETPSASAPSQNVPT